MAAVYLAARQTGVKIIGAEWWRVWDVEREELGFLVVGMLSVKDFAKSDQATWADRKIPFTTDEITKEIKARETDNT